MRLVDRLTEVLLTAAARRWPADLRDDRLREWTAEVHVLRAQPFSALRFAVSLACSPAVEDGAAVRWREQLPEVDRAFRAVLALLAVGLATPMLVYGLSHVAYKLLPNSTGPAGEGAAGLGVLALLVVVAGWVGQRFGAALPFGGRARAAGAVAAMLLVQLGWQLGKLNQSLDRDGTTLGVGLTPVTAMTWALMLSLLFVAYVAARLAKSGHLRWAVAAAVGGTFSVIEAIGVVVGVRPAIVAEARLATAPLWTPLALAYESARTMPARFEQISTVVSEVGAAGIRSLVVMATFALAFGVAAARSRVTVTAVEPVTSEPSAAGAPAHWVSWLGLGAAAAGLLAWATTIAVVTPVQRATVPVVNPTMSAEDQQSMRLAIAEDQLMGLLEQQLSAILLATLGVFIFLARRGPALLPATLFAVVLATADVLLARHQVGGAQVFVGALVGGAITVGAAVALSAALGGGQRPDARSVRRLLIGAAVFAALCAPTLYWAGAMWESRNFVSGFRATAVLLALLLAALAATCALAARTERPTPWLVIVAVVVPVATAALGALFLQRSHWVLLALAAAPLFAVLTLAAATWTAGTSAWRWIGLGVGAVVLGVPFAYLQLYAGLALGDGVVDAAGYVQGMDSLNYLPGTLAVGLPLAAVAAGRAVRRVPRVPATRTAREVGPALMPEPVTEPG